MTINVRLRVNNTKDGSEYYHPLEDTTNSIGRTCPPIIADSRISRKHAEIIVSQETSTVTYLQLGQNIGKLFRSNSTTAANNNGSGGGSGGCVGSGGSSNGTSSDKPIKLVKGQPATLLANGDTIYLCDHTDIILTVIIEDDQIQPMETGIEDDQATQVDDLDLFHDDDFQAASADNGEDGDDGDDGDGDGEGDQDDQLLKKRDRGDYEQQGRVTKDRLKKIKYATRPAVNANNPGDVQIATTVTTTTTTTTTNNNNTIQINTTVQQQQTPQKQQQMVAPQSKPNSSPIYIADDTRVNLSEDELVYIRRLGQGSCGEVSQYEWRGTQVAVKIIFRSLIHKEKNGEFEKETQILKCLRHPNVVLFMGTCLLKGNLAIITEYLNKGSLRDVLNSKSHLSWNTKIKMMLDVAQGMNYLHSYNPKIIHRDLKSLNLLVDNNYNVKVSDFGLSRFSTGNEARTFCGTLPWIAPEVFTRSGYSTKADVFSFGVVLWEVLTRQTPSGNIAGSTNGHPDIPPDCPIPFAQLIKDCCSKSPEQRPNFTQIINRLKSMFVIKKENENKSNNSQDENNNSNNNNNNNKEKEEVKNQKLYEWKIDNSEISQLTFIKKTETYTLFSGMYKGELVALKTFQQSVQDFERKELSVLANLQSPRILSFHGVVYNEDEYALVTSTYGQSLLQHMTDTTPDIVFNWQHTIDLAIQVAECLHTLHQFKPAILHRGITSECFVFKSNSQEQHMLAIGDFGLSRFNTHENLLSLAQIKGSYIYSPPELFKSVKYSIKSDIYSFSIVLWELIERCLKGSYQTPFSDIKLDYDFQIIHQTSKFNKRPLLDDKIPQGLVKLLKSCWDSDPQQRPDTERIIAILKEQKEKLSSPNSNSNSS
ncbi:SMAD/FHA domain-containing protein [Cavenderia fasciculata]|uniref:SMAD/FHA domain-containing protein n=1 Tax=Cavenderia fasciculata TaxID=261658 RepID=F4PVL8_CACFS|nr:SMAD/FHA domain-containing protein [Cavenderia fasciculata]EGG20032.1 SMAD/FHA domain-containing protein [Cavenderia fasciculata]|eukprot:XP_004367015.1 SMAD/FHA domain-containing protein [Cavenderia fasciculata]